MWSNDLQTERCSLTARRRALVPGGWLPRFTVNELTGGYWIKIGQHGVSRVLQFFPDGTLHEQDLFTSLPIDVNSRTAWVGSWHLDLNGEELQVFAGPYRL